MAPTTRLARGRIMEPVTSKLEAVSAAAKAYRRSEAATRRARSELHAAILEATEAGERQVDIAEKSTYKREQIRRIVEAAKRRPNADHD